jgi:RNA polymerase sigma factor (sigma-70 family)
MLKSLKLVPNPEDQFIERYERLHAWALALTSGDHERAEDLVHDAFIQFTLRRVELGAIENLDAYLHRMLRNMFLSEVRAANVRELPLSIADFESAELGLRSVDPQTRMQIAEDLHRICRYASARKETSKAGSVLILRFFHGYYLNEIAQVLRSGLPAVYDWLKLARREARAYLDDPSSLRFIVYPPTAETRRPAGSQTSIELLNELRNEVFDSRRGACLSPKHLHRLYGNEAIAKLNCAQVAHNVSCPVCLDEVNEMLDLPPLAERFPTDTVGRSGPPRGGGEGGGSEDGGTGSVTTDPKQKHTRRFKEVFDHRPQELRVSVNGFQLGSQKVGLELSEQTISVNIDERIGFVEVFSEQGVRLLFFEVSEPVDGDVEQRTEASFSDGRQLQLSLNFRSTWPTLNVLYRDPALKPVVEALLAENAVSAQADDPLPAVIDEPQQPKPTFFEQGSQIAVRVFRRITRNATLWLRPSTVTALFALVLLLSLVFVYRKIPAPPVSAGDMLQKAAMNEDAVVATRDQVLHRTINLAERRAGGQLITRRIEIWQSGEKGITARRLYDEKGQLVAGDWRRADGVQTLYHHGAPSRLQLGNPQLAVRSFDDAWQLSVSAKEFTTLIGSTAAHLEERPASYAISYAGETSNTPGLVRAVIILSKNDLRAIEQTLTIQQGSEQREFHFVEINYERRHASAVAPSVFEPEPELIGRDAETLRRGDAENIPASRSLPVPVSPALATPELEVEVLGLLHQAGADMGEQVSVLRTAGGQLRIEGIVDSDQRKAEIQSALSSVLKHPAVALDISTVAEAVKRASVNSRPSAPTTVERSTATETSIPIDAELRSYFSSQGKSRSQLDQEVQLFTRQVLGHSDQMLRHAGALKKLAQQFSQHDLQAMDAEARAKFLSLIRAHSQALQKQINGLQAELGPVFAVRSPADSGSASEINDNAQLVRSIEQLYDLCAAGDRGIRSAFTISPEAGKASAIKSAQFWRGLASAEKLAATIGRR